MVLLASVKSITVYCIVKAIQLHETKKNWRVTQNNRNIILITNQKTTTMNKQQLTQIISANIYAKQGFSINIKGQSPTDGYMVGFKCGELVKATEAILFDEVSDWVDNNFEKLEDANLFAGGWEDKGIYYLEISRNIGLEQAAKDFARKTQQIAIWDVVAGKGIDLIY